MRSNECGGITGDIEDEYDNSDMKEFDNNFSHNSNKKISLLLVLFLQRRNMQPAQLLKLFLAILLHMLLRMKIVIPI